MPARPTLNGRYERPNKLLLTNAIAFPLANQSAKEPLNANVSTKVRKLSEITDGPEVHKSHKIKQVLFGEAADLEKGKLKWCAPCIRLVSGAPEANCQN